MNQIYRSKNYSPDAVTGRYVRCDGRKGAYKFRVFETASDSIGRRGRGATLREYDTDGTGLPDELRSRCIASKSTERWD